MALNEQFFVGTSGTAISSANSGYTLVNPNGGAGFSFSNALANPLTAGTSGAITAAAATAAEGRYTHPDTSSLAAQLIFRVPPAPTASSCDFKQVRGTRQNSGLRYHTGGSLRVLNIGSEISGAGTWADFSTLAGTDVVVDLVTEQGSTSANGRIRARVRALSNLASVLWEYDSGYTRDVGVTGTDVINSSRAWKITAASAFASTWYVYGHRSQDGVTAYLSDPAGAAEPPTVVVTGGDVAYYRYDATGSDLGTSPSLTYSAAHLSGPTGTPIETSDGIFFLPQTTAATTYRITATGADGTDTEDVIVPAPSAGGIATGIVRKRWNGTALVG